MKTAHDSKRVPAGRLAQPKALEVVPREYKPTFFYRLDEFVADHRRLAAACRLNPEPRPYFGGYSYDRFVPILTGLIRALSQTEQSAESVFCERYGLHSGTVRWSRFRLVLRFLDDWQADLSASGLARGSNPIEVREDFVVYLLQHPLSSDRSSIPRDALARFLDEVGHRWM